MKRAVNRGYSTEVRRAIAERAYFISEKQGFAVGHAEENWFAAEAEVLGDLLQQHSGTITSGAQCMSAPGEKTKKSTVKRAKSSR